MDIYIKWSNGSMTVHLEQFLTCRNISKVRKLVKVIRESYTPECEEKIREYIEQELEQFEPKQKENSRYIIGYTEKAKFCQQQLDNCIYNRDRFKKKSEGWEHYNNRVKAYREELKELKSQLRIYKKQFSQGMKNKEFYTKVLEIIT